MFTGKGGVGKTSVVAGCALSAAKAGRRPLVVELGHRASLEAVFAPADGAKSGVTPRVDYEAREVTPGVHALNLDFEPALIEYLEDNLKLKRLVRAVTRNKPLMRFFQAAPSVGEVATLHKLAALEAERDADGRPRWDPILVDLDATGHALMLLNLPRVMDGLIGNGPMRGLIDGFSQLLSDPQRCALNLVTLARELPAQETLELYEKLERDHAVPLGVCVINRVPSRPFSDELATRLEELAAANADLASTHPAAARALVVAERAQSRHARAREQISRLQKAIDLPLVHLPACAGGLDVDTLRRFGDAVLARGEVKVELESASRPTPAASSPASGGAQ